MESSGVQKAGEVKIEELKLLSSTNLVFDLREFLVEFNLYEDLFSNYLRGNIVLTDSRNLIEIAPLIGEEYLTVKISTPGMESKIQKTFRVFKVSDRQIVRDNNTQNFVLHFASIELMGDVLLPLFKPHEGMIHDVVGEIFTNYISQSREFNVSEANGEFTESTYDTPLYILNPTSNKVKFVPTGWSPFKCINWLASKAIPKDGVARNYLFFETNKAFCFGTLETIFKDAYTNKNFIGRYSISAANIRDGARAPDINREYFIAKDVEMVETIDHIKNYTNGYLSNRLITLDIYNKKYDVIDYDYVTEYSKQYHTSGEGAKARPTFTVEGIRNPVSSTSFYPVNEKLFDGFSENISERMKDIYGNRRSSMIELTNVKMNITVPGRTDVEVGRMLYFHYPAIEPVDNKSPADNQDTMYSGYYLITAIRHKVNKEQHTMTMEIIKDSMTVEK